LLKARAPFPHPSSYGLLQDGDRLRAVRIIDRQLPGLATISFLDQPSASGQRRVLAAELIDADPLCAEEMEEMAALAKRLRGRKANRDKADEARLESLRRRHSLAPVLDAALRDQRAREERALRSANYAQRRDDFRRGLVVPAGAS